MKKKIIKLLVCTGLICMALTGCEDKKSEVKNEEKVENNQDVGADVQDILDEATALEDGEYSVGFKPEDVIEKGSWLYFDKNYETSECPMFKTYFIDNIEYSNMKLEALVK